MAGEKVYVRDPAEMIRDYNHDQNLSKWGWIIYRCTYGDDGTWKRFMKILKRNTTDEICDSKAPEILDTLDWKVFEGPEFANADKHMVRQHFRTWAASNEAQAEQPNMRLKNKDGSVLEATPRYTFCLHVDTAALESVVGLSGPLIMDNHGKAYVNMIDVSWRYGVVDKTSGENYDSEEEEEVEGYRCHDVGWMKVAVHTLWVFVYHSLLDTSLYDNIYTRPPHILAPL